MNEPTIPLVKEFSERIVAMLVFKGQLVIATEHGLYAGPTPETVQRVEVKDITK